MPEQEIVLFGSNRPRYDQKSIEEIRGKFYWLENVSSPARLATELSQVVNAIMQVSGRNISSEKQLKKPEKYGLEFRGYVEPFHAQKNILERKNPFHAEYILVDEEKTRVYIKDIHLVQFNWGELAWQSHLQPYHIKLEKMIEGKWEVLRDEIITSDNDDNPGNYMRRIYDIFAKKKHVLEAINIKNF